MAIKIIRGKAEIKRLNEAIRLHREKKDKSLLAKAKKIANKLGINI